MPDDLPIDWRFQQVLDGAVAAQAQRLAQVKAGEVYRAHSGERAFWREGFPSEDERQEARQVMQDLIEAAAEVGELPGAGTCPCCHRTFAIPSTFISLRAHGMCPQCVLHEDCGFGGTIAYRMPTLEEVLEVPSQDMRTAEIDVLRWESRGW